MFCKQYFDGGISPWVLICEPNLSNGITGWNYELDKVFEIMLGWLAETAKENFKDWSVATR